MGMEGNHTSSLTTHNSNESHNNGKINNKNIDKLKESKAKRRKKVSTILKNMRIQIYCRTERKRGIKSRMNFRKKLKGILKISRAHCLLLWEM